MCDEVTCERCGIQATMAIATQYSQGDGVIHILCDKHAQEWMDELYNERLDYFGKELFESDRS